MSKKKGSKKRNDGAEKLADEMLSETPASNEDIDQEEEISNINENQITDAAEHVEEKSSESVEAHNTLEQQQQSESITTTADTTTPTTTEEDSTLNQVEQTQSYVEESITRTPEISSESKTDPDAIAPIDISNSSALDDAVASNNYDPTSSAEGSESATMTNTTEKAYTATHSATEDTAAPKTEAHSTNIPSNIETETETETVTTSNDASADVTTTEETEQQSQKQQQPEEESTHQIQIEEQQQPTEEKKPEIQAEEEVAPAAAVAQEQMLSDSTEQLQTTDPGTKEDEDRVDTSLEKVPAVVVEQIEEPEQQNEKKSEAASPTEEIEQPQHQPSMATEEAHDVQVQHQETEIFEAKFGDFKSEEDEPKPATTAVASADSDSEDEKSNFEIPSLSYRFGAYGDISSSSGAFNFADLQKQVFGGPITGFGSSSFDTKKDPFKFDEDDVWGVAPRSSDEFRMKDDFKPDFTASFDEGPKDSVFATFDKNNENESQLQSHFEPIAETWPKKDDTTFAGFDDDVSDPFGGKLKQQEAPQPQADDPFADPFQPPQQQTTEQQIFTEFKFEDDFSFASQSQPTGQQQPVPIESAFSDDFIVQPSTTFNEASKFDFSDDFKFDDTIFNQVDPFGGSATAAASSSFENTAPAPTNTVPATPRRSAAVIDPLLADLEEDEILEAEHAGDQTSSWFKQEFETTEVITEEAKEPELDWGITPSNASAIVASADKESSIIDRAPEVSFNDSTLDSFADDGFATTSSVAATSSEFKLEEFKFEDAPQQANTSAAAPASEVKSDFSFSDDFKPDFDSTIATAGDSSFSTIDTPFTTEFSGNKKEKPLDAKLDDAQFDVDFSNNTASVVVQAPAETPMEEPVKQQEVHAISAPTPTPSNTTNNSVPAPAQSAAQEVDEMEVLKNTKIKNLDTGEEVSLYDLMYGNANIGATTTSTISTAAKTPQASASSSPSNNHIPNNKSIIANSNSSNNNKAPIMNNKNNNRVNHLPPPQQRDGDEDDDEDDEKLRAFVAKNLDTGEAFNMYDVNTRLNPVCELVVQEMKKMDAKELAQIRQAQQQQQQRTEATSTTTAKTATGIAQDNTRPWSPSTTSIMNHNHTRNIAEYITSVGYPVEEHTTTTEDGYILTLHRIPFGYNHEGHPNNNNNNSNTPKPVVLLLHGLIWHAASWAVTGPGRALAFILADAGFDVWLGNARGTPQSRRHVRYVSADSDARYWKWTFVDMAKYDTPAQISFVLKHTGVASLSIVGHSQGALQALLALSDSSSRDNQRQQHLQSKVNLVVALAPMSTLKHQRSHLFKIVAKIKAEKMYDILGAGELSARYLARKLFPPSDNHHGNNAAFSARMIKMLSLFDESNNIDPNKMSRIMTYEPSCTSVTNITHWCQIIRSGSFQAFDYGSEAANQAAYGTSRPPPLELKGLNVPVAVFYGGNDVLATVQDVEEFMLPLLRRDNNNGGSGSDASGAVVKATKEPSYGHVDFIFAEDACTKVYPDVVALLQQYNNNNNNQGQQR